MTRPRRIATTLSALVATTLVIGLGVEAWVSSRAYEGELLREALTGLHRLSDTLQRSMRYAMLHDDRPAIAHAIATVGAGDVIEHVRLLNKDGLVKASSREPEVGQQVDTSDVACRPCHGEGLSPRSRVTPEERSAIFRGADGVRRFQVVEPVVNERACSTAGCHVHSADQKVPGVLTITTSLAHIDAGIAAFRWRTLALSVVVIALVTGLVLLVLRRLVSRRIRRLLEGTRRVASGDLAYRLPKLGRDEFGVLAESFNRMTTTLSETRGLLLQSEGLASLGRMSAGGAHDPGAGLGQHVGRGALALQREVAEGGAQHRHAPEEAQVAVFAEGAQGLEDVGARGRLEVGGRRIGQEGVDLVDRRLVARVRVEAQAKWQRVDLVELPLLARHGGVQRGRAPRGQHGRPMGRQGQQRQQHQRQRADRHGVLRARQGPACHPRAPAATAARAARSVPVHPQD